MAKVIKADFGKGKVKNSETASVIQPAEQSGHANAGGIRELLGGKDGGVSLADIMLVVSVGERLTEFYECNPQAYNEKLIRKHREDFIKNENETAELVGMLKKNEGKMGTNSSFLSALVEEISARTNVS